MPTKPNYEEVCSKRMRMQERERKKKEEGRRRRRNIEVIRLQRCCRYLQVKFWVTKNKTKQKNQCPQGVKKATVLQAKTKQ